MLNGAKWDIQKRALECFATARRYIGRMLLLQYPTSESFTDTAVVSNTGTAPNKFHSMI